MLCQNSPADPLAVYFFAILRHHGVDEVLKDGSLEFAILFRHFSRFTDLAGMIDMRFGASTIEKIDSNGKAASCCRQLGCCRSHTGLPPDFACAACTEPGSAARSTSMTRSLGGEIATSASFRPANAAKPCHIRFQCSHLANGIGVKAPAFQQRWKPCHFILRLKPHPGLEDAQSGAPLRIGGV